MKYFKNVKRSRNVKTMGGIRKRYRKAPAKYFKNYATKHSAFFVFKRNHP